MSEQPRGHRSLAVLTLGFVIVSMATTYGTVHSVTESLGLLSTVAIVSLCVTSWVLLWVVVETGLRVAHA